MILPINNSKALPIYYNKQTNFRGQITKFEKQTEETVKKNIKHFNISEFLFNLSESLNYKINIAIEKIAKKNSEYDNKTKKQNLLKSVAKLFDRDLKFDDYGSIKEIDIYKDGQIKKVKHYSGRLVRPTSVDEYKDGVLSKSTEYYDSSKKPHWIIEYNSNGNDILREFYQNGCEKSFQVEKDNKIISIAYFDEFGDYKRGEKFDSDKNLSSVISYGNRIITEEFYNSGILTLKSERFLDRILTRNTFYDENKIIKYINETNDKGSIYYHYTDGKKDWSETKYKDNCILYKKTVYNKYGKPKTEELYDKNRILRQKIEYLKNETKDTKYNKDGIIIFTEITNNKTKKTDLL